MREMIGLDCFITLFLFRVVCVYVYIDIGELVSNKNDKEKDKSQDDDDEEENEEYEENDEEGPQTPTLVSSSSLQPNNNNNNNNKKTTHTSSRVSFVIGQWTWVLGVFSLFSFSFLSFCLSVHIR